MKEWKMKIAIKLLLSLLFAGIAVFCVFGFLCTYEPMPWFWQMLWRVIYAVVCVAALFFSFRIWRTRRPGKMNGP